jgi:hypothetical protein
MASKQPPQPKRVKKEIPLPALARKYRWLLDVHKGQDKHLEWALGLEDDPAALAGWAADSVEHFWQYCNLGERFRPKPPALKRTDKIETGDELARAMWNAGGHKTWPIKCGRKTKHLRLLDYEVPPARTTKHAEFYLNRFEKNGKGSLHIQTDLLLSHPDGTPVVGEAKVAKGNGFDSDTVLALIQALAAASMLATPNQIARLHRYYGTRPDAQSVDVALFLYKPQKLPNSTFQRRLEAIAWLVAHRAMQEQSFPSQIRSVYFIDVAGVPNSLEFRVWAVAGEQP